MGPAFAGTNGLRLALGLVAALVLAVAAARLWEAGRRAGAALLRAEAAALRAEAARSALEAQRDRVAGAAAFWTWLGRHAPWLAAALAAFGAGLVSREAGR